MFDALVVGAGITGAVLGRYMAEEGLKVKIIEKRNHIGGNVFDYRDENGVLIQNYGPHIFHTNSKRVYDYICQHGEWNPFFLTCMAQLNGKFTPSPFNFQTIDDFFEKDKAELIKQHIHLEYGNSEKATIVEMLESKDAYVKEFADFLFDYDYSLYTAKQWGISPAEIDVSVLKRVPVLFSYKTGYFDDEFQVMPGESFTAFVSEILNHENIEVELGIDAKAMVSICNGRMFLDGKETDKLVVYTGAADELLNCKYGVLPYRSLRFEYKTELVESYQEAPVVAYPQAEGFTRITEYTKLPEQSISGKTVIALEYPQPYEAGKTEPYYPIPTVESQKLYTKYREELDKIPNLCLCGRLGDFKYYNMDQALERALEVCEELKRKWF